MEKILGNETIDEAVRRVVEEVHPQKVILFGSAARGELGERSDLDFLIVLKEVKSRYSETLRLLKVFEPLPVDVLVYSEEDIAEWGHLPGTVMYEALKEGKVLYEAA